MPGPSQALRDEGFYEWKKRAGEGLCWVKGCANVAKTSGLCMCSKHAQRRWRATNKGSADFCTLRDHAKSRSLKFTITLDYWKGLTDAYAFYEPADGEVMTIDRVDGSKGYEPGNLRVVSLSWNSYKSNKERYLPEHVREMMERQRTSARYDKQKWLDLDPPEEPDFWDESDFKVEEPDNPEDPF